MTSRRSLQNRAETTNGPSVQDVPIHVKYRPQRLDDVVGQKAMVTSLRGLLKEKTIPHAYLLSGPAGTGKTTTARIIAAHVGASPSNIIEIDAATHNGVDDMRELTSSMKYQGFGQNPYKVFIIDECHQLSTQAWQSVLKTLEEPPAHVFIVLCTTHPAKVPDSIKTRCSVYHLSPVKVDEILDVLEAVCDAEGIDAPDSALSLIARAAQGSPRRALTLLATARACLDDEDEVRRLLEVPDENADVIELCRKLLDRSLSWKESVAIIKRLPDSMSAESVRIVVVNYLAACAMGAKTEKDAGRVLDVLHLFSKPFPATDKMAPLLLAIGEMTLD